MGCFKYSFCSNSTNLENAKKKSGYMIYYFVALGNIAKPKFMG